MVAKATKSQKFKSMENNKNNLSNDLRKEVKKQTISYLLAALGLVAGLAWNEAIKSLINYFFPLKGSSLLAQFIYAILLTIVVVVITMYLSKLLDKEEK
jgi:polyferredoxin